DQTGVYVEHLIESVPRDGARQRLYRYRSPAPGDLAFPTAGLVVVDVEAGSLVEAKSEPLLAQWTSPIMTGQVWWSDDGRHVYWVEGTRGARTIFLKRVNASTGEVETLLEESDDAHVFAPGTVVVLEATGEIVWCSDRDGWSHLYVVRDGDWRQ